MSEEIARSESYPEHPFAQYVRILGKGKSGSRSLTQQEARHAFSLILSEQADPIQLGAFLMLLRVKEETAEELAGFIRATREQMLQPPAGLSADLDWSSYAGKKHQHPWFVLVILLLAQANQRVLVHGSDGSTAGRFYTGEVFRALNLPIANDWTDVAKYLDDSSICYLPLRKFCPALDSLMHLRHLLGLRSPVNTMARLLNPLNSPFSLQSVFHPAYVRLHHGASRLLEQPSALVFKGESGEAEIRPHADTQLNYLMDGIPAESSSKRSITERVSAVASPEVRPLINLWRGESTDTYGLQAVLATTGAVLRMLEPNLDDTTAANRALALWHERDKSRLDPCH